MRRKDSQRVVPRLLAGALLTSGFLFVTGVCPAAEPPAPRDATVVALGAVGVPEAVASLAQRVPAIESAVAAWLRARDMGVFTSSEFEAVWQGRLQVV